MLQYILECMAFQWVFLVIYDIFLKRETFFQWNRVYLLSSYVISMVLPWVKIEALKTRLSQPFAGYSEFLWRLDGPAITVQSSNNPSHQLGWQEWVLYLGMIMAAVLFLIKVRRLYQLKKQGKRIKYPDFTQIIIANSTLAFSFFRSIFLGDKIFAKQHDAIIAHEMVHIRQGHTWDLLFFELMRIVGWFNPLVYVYQSRTSELHEFIADAQVAKERRGEHYQQLLSQIFQTEHISFINQFFTKSLIKKRIVMLQKAKSSKISQLKYLVLVPIMMGMLFYTSCEEGIEEKVDLHQNIVVGDLENLTEEEENQTMHYLQTLLAQPQEWSLVIRDNTSKITLSKAPEGSGISGPGNALIPAKMHIESKVLDQDFSFFKGAASTPLQIKLPNGTIPFAAIDKVPIFPGCEDAEDPRACFNEKMIRHISKNFNYPQEAQDLGIEGRVSVLFTIDAAGNIQDIKQRGPHRLLEDEVNRIISRLPKMEPGQHQGKAVAVPYSIPVTFQLDDSEEITFTSIEKAPIFPGCEGAEDPRACFNEKIMRHISKNFHYPEEAQMAGIQGQVSTVFTINQEGVIEHIKTRGPHALLEGEVKRIVERLPNMQPGRHQGKAVAVPYSIPVTFKLN